jgi:hypothetical protein
MRTCAFFLGQNRGQIRDRRHRISLGEDPQRILTNKFGELLIFAACLLVSKSKINDVVPSVMPSVMPSIMKFA